ncbi:hypothetical protein VNI00_018030 [Paramarasmius palmivorus]|uniref:Uncharacterized protein n=1 Tax=Paramarasmius palmivorus TaxID=297713 RepID=A0AAW0B335_9AGAR
MLGETYAYQDAANKLEELAVTRTTSGYLSHPLASYSQAFPESEIQIYSTRTASGQAWHLTNASNDLEIGDEAVFTIQGIISQCDLPPVVRPYGKSVSPKHLRQRVLLTGLNTATFSHALEGLARVDNILRLNIRDDAPPRITALVQGYPALEITNRYFTSKRMASEEDHLSFANDIDPNGILEQLRGDSLVHTSDNAVQYFQRLTANGGQQFKAIKPAHIKKGDIAEIQFTISLVEVNAGKGKDSRQHYITKLVLRSITQLDRSFSDACRLRNGRNAPRPSLKRKIGHEDEEAKETQDRIKRMAVDEPNLLG